jgi:hypothetical protein
MNNAFATTGLVPLTIGSVYKLQFSAFLGGVFWDLTGGLASLLMTDPYGNAYSFVGTIAGGGGYVQWVNPGPAGTWTRAWRLTDAQGVQQTSRPIAFAVVSSPS